MMLVEDMLFTDEPVTHCVIVPGSWIVYEVPYCLGRIGSGDSSDT